MNAGTGAPSRASASTSRSGPLSGASRPVKTMRRAGSSGSGRLSLPLIAERPSATRSAGHPCART
jgi:hypothetical protein